MELDWIRKGFKGWDVRSDLQGNTSDEHVLSTVQLVKRYWVNDQQRYFHRASHRDEDGQRIRRWLAKRPRFHLHFTPTSASWLNLVIAQFYSAGLGTWLTYRRHVELTMSTRWPLVPDQVGSGRVGAHSEPMCLSMGLPE